MDAAKDARVAALRETLKGRERDEKAKREFELGPVMSLRDARAELALLEESQGQYDKARREAQTVTAAHMGTPKAHLRDEVDNLRKQIQFEEKTLARLGLSQRTKTFHHALCLTE